MNREIRFDEIDQQREHFLHEGSQPYKNRQKALLEIFTSLGTYLLNRNAPSLFECAH
jgi:hypothetical protein